MKSAVIASEFLLSLCLLSAVQAGPVPGRWEKVDALASATELEVVLKSGECLNVHFEQSSDEMMLVRRKDGSPLELPKSAVKEVALSEIKGDDDVWNGLGIGAGVGAASYLIGHAAIVGAPAAHDVAGAAIFAAIGMGVGALIDASVRHEVVLYRSN